MALKHNRKNNKKLLLNLYDNFIALEREKFERMLKEARVQFVKNYKNNWEEEDYKEMLYSKRIEIFNLTMLDKCQREIRKQRGKGSTSI